MTSVRMLPVYALLLLAAACGSGSAPTGPTAAGATTPAGAASTEASSPAQQVNDGGKRDATGLTSVAVAASNFVFSPSVIVARPGQVLKLVVHNGSSTPHNISQADQHVNTDLAPGTTSTVTLTVPASGRLVFTCEYHAGAGMAGTVGPAGATTQTSSGSYSSGGGTAG